MAGVYSALLVLVSDAGRNVGPGGMSVAAAAGDTGVVGCAVTLQPAVHNIEGISNDKTVLGFVAGTTTSTRYLLQRAHRVSIAGRMHLDLGYIPWMQPGPFIQPAPEYACQRKRSIEI